MKKVVLLLSAILLFPAAAFAQVRAGGLNRRRIKPKRPAPESFAAKYEGGLFGYNDKQVGTLKFDDDNDRLVFFGTNQKEKFSMPYGSMLIIYPQSQSVTSTTGNVVKWLPLPGAALGGLIKEKRRYLVVHFDDPDVEAKGVVNFKLDTKELLDSVVDALAEKAKIIQRGDAFYRRRLTRPTRLERSPKRCCKIAAMEIAAVSARRIRPPSVTIVSTKLARAASNFRIIPTAFRPNDGGYFFARFYS